MALFKRTRHIEKPAANTASPRPASAPRVSTPAPKGTHAGVLVSPRITEKASLQMERGGYVFLVAPGATKRDVRNAVREVYGVTPQKVNMVKIPAKIVYSMRRRQKGVKAGGKKAYVFLKAGEKIDVV